MTMEEIAIKLTDHENRIRTSESDIGELKKTQKEIWDLTNSVKELANSLKHMVEEQKKQNERIKALEDAPAKRWKDSTKAIFNAFLGSLGTAIGAMLIFGISHWMKFYMGW